MICNLFRSLEVISQRGSQLRKWSFNLRSGTRVLGGGFTAVKHLAKFHKWISFRSSFRSCEISHSLMQLSSNGHNFFVSAPNCTPFEALDSWLPKLRNDIYYVKNGLHKMLQIFLVTAVLWISHSMWSFRITMWNCFMIDFFLWSSSLHLLIGLEAHSQGLHKILSHSWLDSMIKKLLKTPKLAKNWLETFVRVLNVPIELKGINYCSKLFKGVYNKL